MRSIRGAADIDSVVAALAHGVPDGAPRAIEELGGMNGPARVQSFETATTGVDSILKPAGTGAAPEYAAWQLGGAYDVRELLMPLGMRADGTAASLWLPDAQRWSEAGLHDVASLRAAIRDGLVQGGLSPRHAELVASLRVELGGAFDFLGANSDRSGDNGLISALYGAKLADHGFLGLGEVLAGDPLVPALLGAYQPVSAPSGQVAEVSLSGAALDHLGKASEARVRGALDDVRALPLPDDPLARIGEEHVRSEEFAAGVIARHRALRADGGYRYQSFGGSPP